MEFQQWVANIQEGALQSGGGTYVVRIAGWDQGGGSTLCVSSQLMGTSTNKHPNHTILRVANKDIKILIREQLLLFPSVFIQMLAGADVVPASASEAHFPKKGYSYTSQYSFTNSMQTNLEFLCTTLLTGKRLLNQ